LKLQILVIINILIRISLRIFETFGRIDASLFRFKTVAGKKNNSKHTWTSFAFFTPLIFLQITNFLYCQLAASQIWIALAISGVDSTSYDCM
jgi:hypothetical protein